MSLRALTEEANRLGQAALMDPLTGLGNRRLLDRRLRLATGELCVVFVDVDHFKAVNDTFGHDVGDGVLIQVAAILQELTRADDTVVRYGGDEFVLLIPGVGSDEAQRIASRVHTSVATADWETAGARPAVTVSVGLATETADRALAAADEALLERQAGRPRPGLVQREPAPGSDERRRAPVAGVVRGEIVWREHCRVWGAWRRTLDPCRSTETKVSCCAPRSWVRRTASSRS